MGLYNVYCAITGAPIGQGEPFYYWDSAVAYHSPPLTLLSEGVWQGGYPLEKQTRRFVAKAAAEELVGVNLLDPSHYERWFADIQPSPFPADLYWYSHRGLKELPLLQRYLSVMEVDPTTITSWEVLRHHHLHTLLLFFLDSFGYFGQDLPITSDDTGSEIWQEAYRKRMAIMSKFC